MVLFSYELVNLSLSIIRHADALLLADPYAWLDSTAPSPDRQITRSER